MGEGWDTPMLCVKRRGCSEGDNIKTKSLWEPADVLQGISYMRFRRVSRSVGGGHAAFRMVHASQLVLRFADDS